MGSGVLACSSVQDDCFVDAMFCQDQDPASFDQQAVGYMRQALELRYSLLPFMYTWLFFSHMTGTPVVRPLFMLSVFLAMFLF